MDGCRMRKAVRHVLRLRGAVGQRSPRVVEYTPCGVVRCSPCETVRSTLAAWGVRQRSPRPRSTHLTGSLGSTQTELGPLVGGESECLGGVGQQVGHLVVHRGNGHLVTNLLA